MKYYIELSGRGRECHLHKEARFKLSSNAGYTYLALSFGPEDCPLI